MVEQVQFIAHMHAPKCGDASNTSLLFCIDGVQRGGTRSSLDGNGDETIREESATRQCKDRQRITTSNALLAM
eukprot:1159876-Pelagomonas_calceolata.AAC.5